MVGILPRSDFNFMLSIFTLLPSDSILLTSVSLLRKAVFFILKKRVATTNLSLNDSARQTRSSTTGGDFRFYRGQLCKDEFHGVSTLERFLMYHVQIDVVAVFDHYPFL